jgi:hypothetical protein
LRFLSCSFWDRITIVLYVKTAPNLKLWPREV